jgi:hypothetical protein
MPKVAIDYSKTIIYKLCCNDINITDIYIGHTTNFKIRKANHKTSYNNEKDNRIVYKFIKNNGGWSNWSMIMIEEYPCNSLLEALKQERYWIEKFKATLNMTIPSRTFKEYKQDNRENILIDHKKYYENNKQKIKDMYKTKIICVCGCSIRQYDKKRHETTKKHINFMLTTPLSTE